MCHIQCTAIIYIHRHSVASLIRIASEKISENGVERISIRRVACEGKTHLSQCGATFERSHSDIFHAVRDLHRRQRSAVFECLYPDVLYGKTVIGGGDRNGRGRSAESGHGISRLVVRAVENKISGQLIHILITIGIRTFFALMQVVSLREERGLHRAHSVVV